MATVTIRAPRTEADVWRVARWAFGSLFRQAMLESGANIEIRAIFEQAIALDGLNLHLLDPRVAGDVRRALLEVAERAAVGAATPPVEVEGRVLDSVSQEQFRIAASELVTLLKNETPNNTA